MRVADAPEYGVTWDNTPGAMATEMLHGGMRNFGDGTGLSQRSLIDYSQVRHVMFAVD